MDEIEIERLELRRCIERSNARRVLS